MRLSSRLAVIPRASSTLAAALALFAAAPGCGPTATPRDGTTAGPELRTLDETRALGLIAEVLAEEGVATGAGWTVAIAPERALEVDVRLATSSFGVEWISAQDRVDVGDAVPPPAEGGQLRIVPGMGEDAGAQILVLEHDTYEFANEREHVQRGVPSAHEAEERLRRDVRDFLHYVRGQGAAL